MALYDVMTGRFDLAWESYPRLQLYLLILFHIVVCLTSWLQVVFHTFCWNYRKLGEPGADHRGLDRSRNCAPPLKGLFSLG
ncbi:hypothetical protein L211DRAFT_39147 [Terfezia boudieri ATCC MYA-4762]|uniref:Uncharacterized protein n=1 Tax=Terfezia boudieri ATCC MYA-4762 TaxID=1051890 RepID=A0A3N4M7T9_9PEZI|nr:hypothetical protein L211DRAFT_39147 [Terfezia boudieri ATCC MYA-4762]